MLKKIHGEWQISQVKDVLVTSLAGVFNEEGTRAYFAEALSKAPTDKAWAALSNSENWDMSCAASLELFAEMRRYAFAHQCQCLAVVIPSFLRKTIHQRQTGHFSEDKVAYFSNLEEACVWLQAKGFDFHTHDYPHTEFIQRAQSFLGVNDEHA
ncbi:MAG: hypothetical protein ACEQSE_14165 [Candidatus Aquirickettsiella gammari]